MVYTRSQVPVGVAPVVTLLSHISPTRSPPRPYTHRDLFTEAGYDRFRRPTIHKQDMGVAADAKLVVRYKKVDDADMLVCYKSLKRLDFTAAPGITVIDIFQIHHLVRGPLAQSLDGMRFFLRWFAVGGALLQRPQDVALLHQNGNYLNDATWASQIFPGDRLRIVVNDSTTVTKLRSTIFNRLLEFMSERSVLARHDTFEGVLKETRLLLGSATTRMFEPFLDRMIEYIWTHGRQLGLSGRKATTSSRVQQTCLLCNKLFKTDVGLAKHVRCHAYFLRCPDEDCPQCERKNTRPLRC